MPYVEVAAKRPLTHGQPRRPPLAGPLGNGTKRDGADLPLATGGPSHSGIFDHASNPFERFIVILVAVHVLAGTIILRKDVDLTPDG